MLFCQSNSYIHTQDSKLHNFRDSPIGMVISDGQGNKNGNDHLEKCIKGMTYVTLTVPSAGKIKVAPNLWSKNKADHPAFSQRNDHPP